MKKINYRKVGRFRYFGRCGKYYIFIYAREHGKWDGFDKYVRWYTVRIGSGGEWMWGEGRFGSYLKTLKKAKDWVKNKIKENERGRTTPKRKRL